MSLTKDPSYPLKRVLFEEDTIVVEDVEFALQGKKLRTVGDTCAFLEKQDRFRGTKVRSSLSASTALSQTENIYLYPDRAFERQEEEDRHARQSPLADDSTSYRAVR